MARVPIALELYSVRHDLQKDLRGTLKAVADMGYDGVEFAGGFPLPAEELRAIVDEVGLVCCSWHTPIDAVKEDKLADTIAYNKIMGNKSIIIPGLPRQMTATAADWRKTAQFFNDLSDKLAEHGMYTGYHNHHMEFQPVDGEIPWDIFFGNTKKEVVMQLDLGNALFGGADLVSILENYRGRQRSVHLKPFSQKEGQSEAGFKALIGEDSVPWADIFQVCESKGETEWYIVEYESDAYPPLEAVDRCLKNLRAMGK